jgi:hypothetical protein
MGREQAFILISAFAAGSPGLFAARAIYTAQAGAHQPIGACRHPAREHDTKGPDY